MKKKALTKNSLDLGLNKANKTTLFVVCSDARNNIQIGMRNHNGIFAVVFCSRLVMVKIYEYQENFLS